MKTYKVINGTSYDERTNSKVIEVLERVRAQRIRIRVYYGDIITGRSWLEEHDIFGYVGRSNGNSKIPLLVFNNRSYGGGALLDHCIVKITTSAGGNILYKHPSFHTPDLKIVENSVNSYTLFADNKEHANGTRNQIINLCKKLS
jgi:hypothetical protein